MSASLLACLVALEFGLRFVDGVSLWPDRNLLLARVDRFVRRGEQIHDPVLGWVLRSNLSTVRQWVGGRYPVTSGEEGVRMNEAEIRPVPRRAILAVGDSFTFGAEVGDADTWPAQLEGLLGEPVVNAGVGGYGTDQIVLRAESLIEGLAPKLVIVSFLSGDVLRTQQSVFGGGSKPYFTTEGGELHVHNTPVPPPDVARAPELTPLRRWIGHSYVVEWTLSRLGVQSWFEVPNTRRIANDPTEVSCLLLERLKRRLDADQIRMLFTMQWQGDEVARRDQRTDYAAHVLECASAAGIQTIDTWETLKSAANQGALASLYNQTPDGATFMHMSARGNTVIASLLAAAVRDASFVALPPRTIATQAEQRQLAILGPQATTADLEVARSVAAGPDGALSATLLDDRATKYGVIYQDVPVEDDRTTHTFSIALKAATSPLTQIVLSYLGGDQPVTYYAFVDTALMVANGDGAIRYRPLDAGWTQITLAGANNGSGNRTLRVHLYPRHGTAEDVGAIYADRAVLDP